MENLAGTADVVKIVAYRDAFLGFCGGRKA
jgi:hypothetical protein